MKRPAAADELRMPAMTPEERAEAAAQQPREPQLQTHTAAYASASPPARAPATVVHSFPTPSAAAASAHEHADPWASPPPMRESRGVQHHTNTPAFSSPQSSASSNRSQSGSSTTQQQQQQQTPPFLSPSALATPSSMPLPSASHMQHSGVGGGRHDYMIKRRGGAEQAREAAAAAAASASGDESDSSGKPHSSTAYAAPSSSSSTSVHGRKIIRVKGKRQHYSSWGAELQAMLAPVLGQPRLKNGKLNKPFWVKAAAMALLLLLLIVWLCSGRPSREIRVPTTPFVRAVAPHRGDIHGHTRALDLPPLTIEDVTIFTVHSPESTEHNHNLHVRAINSWLLRVASPAQIHVYVREYAHCLSVLELGVVCRVSGCWDDVFDAPRLTCLFNEANSRATSELMFYVDDHLILFQDALPALLHVGRLEHFVMLGRSQPLAIKLDEALDLVTWQRDLESAVFLDSSAEQNQDLLGQAAYENLGPARESKSLHYMAYARTELDLSVLPEEMLMDGGSYLEHSWESSFLATLLVQDDVHVIDASTAVTAVEFGHTDPSNHTAIVNAFNSETTRNWTGLSGLTASAKQLEVVHHLRLGRLENAHYVLTGRCPTCTLKENRESDLPLILLRKSNQLRQVIVIATNADYLSLTFNWLCRAQQVGISNFVMLAEDRVSYRILRKMNVAVVLRKDAPYRKQASEPGSKLFQETLYLRALFFHQVVSLGFSLISTHLDTLWLLNPLDLLADPGCDMFVQIEDGHASGGLLTIKGNAVGQSFAQDYLLCEQENWNFLLAHGKPRFSFADDVDIDCVELISTRLMRRSNLKRCVLDPSRYVTEGDFFDRQVAQRKAVWPLFVHLNEALGVRNKTRAFQGWHLWGVDDDAMLTIPRVHDAHSHGELHCVPMPPEIPPPQEDEQATVRIVVHLLASTETKGFELTLLSLANAQYEGAHTTVDLVLTLQQPSSPSASNSAAYLAVTKMAQRFSWPHGSKTLIVLDQFVGATDLWIDNWGLTANNDAFLLVLQAGQILSPVWVQWVRQALVHYFFDPFSYDANLMALSLVHQLLIVGESPSNRFGSRIPSQELDDAAEVMRAASPPPQAANGSAAGTSDAEQQLPTHHLYLYQLVPFTGTLFFPRHFSVFLQWYLAQNVSDPSVPCVPTLLSNRWWIRDPVSNWWVWLERFTFESGWYALYTNFHAGEGATESPRALLVDDAPTAGSLVVSLLKSLGPTETHFPPRSALSLWDLHFEPFHLPPQMLGRRKFMFPPLGSATSMTRALEAEAALHAQGDLVEEPSGLANFKRTGAGGKGGAQITGKLASSSRSRSNDEDPGEHLHPENEEHDYSAESADMAEQDVSHLDVMIESMIQQMEERSGGGTPLPVGQGITPEEVDPSFSTGTEGKPDIASLRAAALQRRGQRRRNLLKPHRAHHARPPRGIDGLDRCYVVDQAADMEDQMECKNCFKLHPTLRHAIGKRLNVLALERMSVYKSARTHAIENGLPIPPPPPAVPDPLASYLSTTVGAEDLYNVMYEMAKINMPSPQAPFDERQSGAPRFVLYQPSKPAPFDGHLRGIYFSFLLALLTNRLLLIDLPDLHLQYSCPFKEASWQWADYAKTLEGVARDTFDNKRSAELRTASLDQLYTKTLLIHQEPTAQDRVLFKNVMYRAASAALFGSSSRMRRTGVIMRLLLSKPTLALTQAATSLQRELGLPDAQHILSVHVVVPGPFMQKPVTAAEPLPGVPGRHWDCVRSFLLSLSLVADKTAIIFSTNRPSPLALGLAQQEMSRFGRVVTPAAAWNANISAGGVSAASSSSSLSVDEHGAPVVDPALLLGYLLGDSDVSISSGTTFGIFHAARTAFVHQALIVKLAAPKKGQTSSNDEDYCGPMHRLDYAMAEDIAY